MVVKQKQMAVDKEVLTNGIRACKAFIVSSPGKKKFSYCYGGGFYDECQSNIVLQVDYIRPKFITIDAKDVIHTMFDGTHCDVLLGSGAWISGVVVERISDIKFDYVSRRYMDKRVIREMNGVDVVNLLLVQPKADMQNTLYTVHTPSKKILKYPNPLTFAYIKEENEVRVGYWDMIKNKLVGETERMELPLLDKSG